MAKDKDEGTTPTPSDTKIDGQCAAPGCLSTRTPNGDKYLCPVHAPKQ